MSDDIEEEKEIVKKDTGIVKDPRYFYYIDKEGNICRKFKGSTKKKDIKNPVIKNYFNDVNLSVPQIVLRGWISKKFKTVRKTGPNGGMIYVPGSLVGNTYQVILIPKEDWIINQSTNY